MFTTYPFLPDWLSITILVIEMALRVIALIVVPRNRRPTTAISWLMLIFLTPEIGWLFFLVFGTNKLPKRRLQKQLEINRLIVGATEGMDLVSEDHDGPDWFEGIVRLNKQLGSMPLIGGNWVTLHDTYTQNIFDIAADIDHAEEYVHIEFYILAYDSTTRPVFDAMERAIKRGVTVRVLLDHIANVRQPGLRKTKRHLDAIGAQWAFMNPFQPLRGKWQRPDLRNHRKLVVIDGMVGWTGSQNLIDRGYHRHTYKHRELAWHDLLMRIEGPTVISLDAVFTSDWYLETGELIGSRTEYRGPHIRSDIDMQVVPSGPGYEDENNLKMFDSLLYAAEKRLSIVSPYFVPDDSLLYAIATASQRGVPVELFVSEIGDQPLVYHAQRSYYEQLLTAGVRIYLFPAPYILHSKHISVDDEVCVIGSSNMDMRSFSLNSELSVLVHSKTLTDQLRGIEDRMRAVCTELTLAEWQERKALDRFKDSTGRLAASLM